MIGQPLNKISTGVALKKDFNNVIDVLRPLQNIQFGSGINGYITPTSLSISVAKQTGQQFEFPFKVESTSLTGADISFGRVFEERVFAENGATEGYLSFIEISSSVAFDPLTGMTIALDPQATSESIVIAVDVLNETSLTNNYYQVCLASAVPVGSYRTAHVIAKLTKESGDTSWTVEQVLMGDYTFDRNPPVPFDVTKYMDKWLIYIPPYSLVINGTNQSDVINGITNSAAIVGDWYQLNTVANNYLTITYGNTLAYGDVTSIDMGPTGSAVDAIKLYDTDGTNVTKQLVKGALNIEKIRPDSGDSSSLYKSIAVQNSYNGITPGDNNYTIELHGFSTAAPLEKTLDFDDVTGIHKIAIREYNDSGITSLRWSDISNFKPGMTTVSGDLNVNQPTSGELSGINAIFDYPWRCNLVAEPGNERIDVTVGRVYQYQSYQANTSIGQADKIFPFAEIPAYQPSVTPGGLYPPIGFSENDYIVLVRQPNVYPDKWELTLESYAISNLPGWHVFQRLARMYKDGTEFKIEQIHMGDVTIVDTTISPFTVASMEGTNIMYLPANSLVINGTDYTSSILSYGPGTAPAVYADWYSIGSGTQNLYIYMKDTADGYGTVNTVELNDSNGYPKAGELIIIPIFDTVLKRSFVVGAINRDIIRTDTYANQFTNMMKSIDASVSNVTADKTFQLRNFKQNTANSSALDGTGAYDYTLVVREVDASNNAEVKYAPWSDIQTVIDTAVESEITNNFETYLQTDFFTWYDGLSSTDLSGRGFWEKGAGSDKNYGTTIGDSTKTSVINLDTRTLETSAWNFNALIGDNVETNNVTTTTLTLSGYQLILYPDGTVRWQ